jgi:sporulation protein YqfC
MKLTQTITEKLDLPADAALNMSKITITGNREAFIENYRGIAEYTTQTVRLGTGSGIIKITGENIGIKSIGTEEITLAGIIRCVELE